MTEIKEADKFKGTNAYHLCETVISVLRWQAKYYVKLQWFNVSKSVLFKIHPDEIEVYRDMRCECTASIEHDDAGHTICVFKNLTSNWLFAPDEFKIDMKPDSDVLIKIEH